MRISRYDLTNKYSLGIRIAHVSDTHGMRADGFLPILRDMKPDFIAVTGDVFHYLAKDPEMSSEYNKRGLYMLKKLAEIAPTCVSFGNHDNGGSGSAYLIKNAKVIRDPSIPDSAKKAIENCGCALLDNSYVFWEICKKRVLIGGQTSGVSKLDRKPDLEWLESFEKEKGSDVKILLCHHPEYAANHSEIRTCGADLILSGHAHGGQINLFGRGLYAPCQGIFPKYFKGIHEIGDATLIVSTGMKNTAPIIPRFFNPCEIVEILI